MNSKFFYLATIVLSACSASVPPTALNPGHPASPEAPEARVPESPTTLSAFKLPPESSDDGDGMKMPNGKKTGYMHMHNMDMQGGQ